DRRRFRSLRARGDRQGALHGADDRRLHRRGGLSDSVVLGDRSAGDDLHTLRPYVAMKLHALRRPVVAGLALLAVYVAVSFANDTRGYLGTDTGAKVAALRAMERHHGLNPDLGYWAARFDPSGAFHPLVGTSHVGGKWLNVSTVPALYLEYPLFRVGGYRLALLVPMLAAVATAFAGRALARRLGAAEPGAWAAF